MRPDARAGGAAAAGLLERPRLGFLSLAELVDCPHTRPCRSRGQRASSGRLQVRGKPC